MILSEILTILIIIVVYSRVLVDFKNYKLEPKDFVFANILLTVAIFVSVNTNVIETISAFLGFQVPSNFVFYSFLVFIFAYLYHLTLEFRKIKNNQRLLLREIVLLSTKEKMVINKEPEH